MPTGQSEHSLIQHKDLLLFMHRSVSCFLPRNLVSPTVYQIVGFYSSEYKASHILGCSAM